MPKHVTESTDAAITSVYEFTTGTCRVTSGGVFTLHSGATITIPPRTYTKTMTGHETFTDPAVPIKTYFLDPDGTNRNFNPNGTFTAGFLAIVYNTGTAGNVVFDSATLKATIAPGQVAFCGFDGTLWR